VIFHRYTQTYGAQIHVVELEEWDLTLSDDDLITLADRKGNYKELADTKGKHPGHFGGHVEKRPGLITKSKVFARIKVNID